jgi:hypothetical protein
MRKVPIADWGKDHWSMLAYIETLCVDSRLKGVGEIDKRRVRANGDRHPLHAVNAADCGAWNPDWGTRLAGYWDTLGRTVPTRKIAAHDDWDCLDDMEKAGLVEVISEANGFVKLTEKGMKIAAEVRAYKAKGGMFSGFRWTEPAPVEKA